MSVHLQIANQINKHIQGQKEHRRLDELRETAIEKVLQKVQNNESFSVQEVNVLTEEINILARKFNFPMRKRVTNEMIKEYVTKHKES